MTREHHLQTIAGLDSILSTLRGFWIGAKPSEKAEWAKKIDSVLDERIKAMKLRDACTIETEG